MMPLGLPPSPSSDFDRMQQYPIPQVKKQVLRPTDTQGSFTRVRRIVDLFEHALYPGWLFCTYNSHPDRNAPNILILGHMNIVTTSSTWRADREAVLLPLASCYSALSLHWHIPHRIRPTASHTLRRLVEGGHQGCAVLTRHYQSVQGVGAPFPPRVTTASLWYSTIQERQRSASMAHRTSCNSTHAVPQPSLLLSNSMPATKLSNHTHSVNS